MDAIDFAGRIEPAPVNGGFKMDDYWVWCGSVIKGEDKRYHMFSSRWPKKYPMFEGYTLFSEIVRAVSDELAGPYHYEESILPFKRPGCWDERMAHNPSILHHNGIYYLFYIGSTYIGLDSRQSYGNIRIGVTSSPSITGPWSICREPILLPRPGKWDNLIVTNPAPCILPDGRTYLYYRSNTPEGLRIGLATSARPEGPYQRCSDEPILQFENNGFVEDPFVWFTDNHFEMLAKDMDGSITGELHAGVHLSSCDGIHWQISSSPKAYSREILWDNGKKVKQGCVERPQIFFDETGKPRCLFAAVADGPGGFINANNTWNMAIPLK